MDSSALRDDKKRGWTNLHYHQRQRRWWSRKWNCPWGERWRATSLLVSSSSSLALVLSRRFSPGSLRCYSGSCRYLFAQKANSLRSTFRCILLLFGVGNNSKAFRCVSSQSLYWKKERRMRRNSSKGVKIKIRTCKECKIISHRRRQLIESNFFGVINGQWTTFKPQVCGNLQDEREIEEPSRGVSFRCSS